MPDTATAWSSACPRLVAVKDQDVGFPGTRFPCGGRERTGFQRRREHDTIRQPFTDQSRVSDERVIQPLDDRYGQGGQNVQSADDQRTEARLSVAHGRPFDTPTAVGDAPRRQGSCQGSCQGSYRCSRCSTRWERIRACQGLKGARNLFDWLCSLRKGVAGRLR